MGRWRRLSLLLSTCSFIQGNDFPPLVVAGALSRDTDLDGRSSVCLRLIPILSVTGALQQQTCLCIDSIWWICINEFASNLIRRTIDTPPISPPFKGLLNFYPRVIPGAEESMYAKLGTAMPMTIICVLVVLFPSVVSGLITYWVCWVKGDFKKCCISLIPL